MRRQVGLLALALVAALGACSGGGSSTAPQAAITPGGAGVAAVFNQKVTFVITVPPAAVTSSSARRARRTGAAAATPYVSPLTGSVALNLAEVNGVSPQQAPPAIAPINVPATCQGSNAGCTIPVANVPAALGSDRYLVQTYTGANATGTLISSGFVDVTVPAKGSAAIGGKAALSIGGYVASITFSPTSLQFVQGTVQSTPVLIQAMDAAGATIIGAGQFATPITVAATDPATDPTSFTVGGSATYQLTGPLLQPLTLHYDGAASPTGGTVVTATSQDSAGNPVSAQLIAQVLPPGTVIGATPTPIPGSSASPMSTATPPTVVQSASPTPTPSPTQKPTQALSLYVADGASDTVSEYRIVTQIEAGTIPNPAVTPSRVIQFNPANVKAGSVGSAGLSCQPVVYPFGNGTAGVAVDPAAGTIFMLPNCTDGSNGYTFGFPANAAGAATPTIYDPFAGGGFGGAAGLALANSHLFAAYNEGSSLGVFGFPLTSNERQPATTIGGTCYAELGSPSPGCFQTYLGGIGADATGYLYIPAQWIDTPTGDASAFQQPAAILAQQASANNATVTPFSVLAGLNTSVGGTGTAPLATTVDGGVLYTLTGSDTLTQNAASNPNPITYFPGVSYCPAPTANALVNEVDVNDNATTQCADQQLHLYLAAYNLPGQLLNVTNFGTDVDEPADFLVGGDVVGDFGCVSGNLPEGGQLLAASGGYVYVINLTSSNCNAATNTYGVLPEIDVYNLNSVNGITGAHTDIAPIFVLPLHSGLPTAIAIGPSGTAVGGQALLRRPSQTYRPYAYGRRRALRRPMRFTPHANSF